MKMSFSSIYDQLYSGNYRDELSGFEIARWKALEHFIPRFIKLNAAMTILDYGAGSGLHVGLWEKIFHTSELHFCDVSAVAMEKFKIKFPQYASRYMQVIDQRVDCADSLYDVVVSVEVMEHVEDLRLYIRDIHRVLKPGGFFVWTTPCGNKFSIEHLYGVFTGAIEPTKEGYRRWKWEDPTHLRRLQSAEIKSLLAQNSFFDIRFRFRAHFFSFLMTYLPVSRGQRLRNFLMTLDYSLFRLLPNGASMIGVARKSVINGFLVKHKHKNRIMETRALQDKSNNLHTPSFYIPAIHSFSNSPIWD